MEFKTIEAPMDNGNHAITQHCGAFACVFCGVVCTGIRTVAIASSRCNARAKKYIALDGETMDALRYAWNGKGATITLMPDGSIDFGGTVLTEIDK